MTGPVYASTEFNGGGYSFFTGKVAMSENFLWSTYGVADSGDDWDLAAIPSNGGTIECLGGCEIAPMASVDGTYVGPLELEDVERLRDDVKAGRPVLEDKQLKNRKAASKHWQR